MERKLAAIMAADIVSYSLMMAENEASTYKELRAVFDKLIEPTVAQHGGRIFKMTGDGFLAMFPSVNEAVDAGSAIQQGFDNAPFELRIGINLGDVIEDNGDMYGDGVNVATRLETMADPGSIFVSGAVVMAADRIAAMCSRVWAAGAPKTFPSVLMSTGSGARNPRGPAGEKSSAFYTVPLRAGRMASPP